MNVRPVKISNLNFKFQKLQISNSKISNFKISYVHAVLECPDLNDPPNGMVMMDKGVIPGSTAIYMCNPGFMPEGDNVRVCELVGKREAQWSGEEPTCTGRFHL